MGRVYDSRVDSLSFSGCKNVLMTALAILFYASMLFDFGDAQSYHRLPPNDYPEIISQYSEIQVMSGREIKLSCDKYSCDGKKIVWEYMPCGSYFNNCYNTKLENQVWRKLRIRNKMCSSNITIVTKSSDDSGLYRCLVNDDKAFRDRKIKIYHVIVVDKVQIYHGSMPNVLEFQPSNVTVYKNMRIVIQCKVNSTLPVEIRWFKEDQNGFTYKNMSYIMLNYSQHVYIERDIYLSKLILDNASETDSGIYICAAINSLGHVFRIANVTVLNIPTWNDEESTSFSMLFLIPVGFALVPIIIWLCYYKKKR